MGWTYGKQNDRKNSSDYRPKQDYSHFTNTRNQAENWYQNLLAVNPDLAGQIAIHHSSIDFELRNWIEDNLASGYLKAVVSTSSFGFGRRFQTSGYRDSNRFQ